MNAFPVTDEDRCNLEALEARAAQAAVHIEGLAPQRNVNRSTGAAVV